MSNTFVGEDGVRRCSWCQGHGDVYMAYHDLEWGFPVTDDIRLFEKISLEGFQSGLSWWTILQKRENFRKAFAGFDFEKIAQFDETDIERLLKDSGIVRHRGKITAVVNNANCAIELRKEFESLSNYFWGFKPQHLEGRVRQSQTQSNESIALSKDLKKRGWKFVGPTTMFAFMQAMGLINDHAEQCEIGRNIENN